MSGHSPSLAVRLGAVAAAFLLAPAAAEDFSDVCHCMQSPDALMEILDRQHVQHGLRNGPTVEMYPDLSADEFLLLREYWDQCDVLRRYYAKLQMQGSGRITSVVQTADGRQEERIDRITFKYYARSEHELRLDLRRESEGTGRSKSLIGVITPSGCNR